MNTFNKLPAGVRLDGWQELPACEPAVDAPEVAELREELRKAVPEFAGMLELLSKLRPVQEMAARIAGPAQWRVVTQRG